MKKFRCPVCGFMGLAKKPYDSNLSGSGEICQCCGFQFGYDDQFSQARKRIQEFHDSYRIKWLFEGAKVFHPSSFPVEYIQKNSTRMTETQLIRQLNTIGFKHNVPNKKLMKTTMN